MAHRHSLTARLAGQPPAIGNRHGLYRLFELRIRSASVCARVAAGPIVAGFRIVPWHRGRPNCAGRRLNAGRTRLTALVGCARPLAPQSTPTSSMASPRRWAGTRWDAERAVRAALEIVHTVKRASSTEDLSVRIGIATGPVVVGETAGVGDQSKLVPRVVHNAG
jgi:hypothetical protein